MALDSVNWSTVGTLVAILTSCLALLVNLVSVRTSMRARDLRERPQVFIDGLIAHVGPGNLRTDVLLKNVGPQPARLGSLKLTYQWDDEDLGKDEHRSEFAVLFPQQQAEILTQMSYDVPAVTPDHLRLVIRVDYGLLGSKKPDLFFTSGTFVLSETADPPPVNRVWRLIGASGT